MTMPKQNQIEMLETNKLVSFDLTVFAVREDESLRQLTQSIKSQGVLTPIIVNYYEGVYRILSGHRRVYVCNRLGITQIPAIVLEGLDYDESLLIVIDSNLAQRDQIRTSEKAKAYKLKLDTLQSIPE